MKTSGIARGRLTQNPVVSWTSFDKPPKSMPTLAACVTFPNLAAYDFGGPVFLLQQSRKRLSAVSGGSFGASARFNGLVIRFETTYASFVQQEFSHRRIDRTNAAQDRQIAARLRRSDRLLRVGRQNLLRWVARDGRRVRPVFLEWGRILTRLSRAEIADFLRSNTPMARRLRQSSPFAGLLGDAERQAVRQWHEKART